MDEDEIAMMSQRAASQMQYQLSTDDILDLIAHNLRGEVPKDEPREDGEGYITYVRVWKQVSQPMLSEDGINAILSELAFVLDKNTFLSDLEDYNIQKICYETHMKLTRHLILHRKQYGLRRSDASRIVNAVMNKIFIGLKRARRGGERNMLQTIRKTVESVHEEQRERGKALNLFGRGGSSE